MAKIGDVEVGFKADLGDIQAGFDQVRKQLEAMESQASTAMSRFESAGNSLIKIGAVMTATAGAGAAAMVLAGRNAGKWAEQLGFLHEQTGFSEEGIQKMDTALHRVNLTFQDLIPGFKKIQTEAAKALADSGAASDNAKERFEAFGITVKDLETLNPEQIFMKVVDGASKMEGTWARNAAVADLFGRSAMRLVPLIAEGAAAFEKAGTDAERFGTVLGAGALENLRQMDDAFDDLGTVMEGFEHVLLETASGPLAAFVRGLTEALGAFNRWWGGLSEGTKSVAVIFAATFAASGPIMVVVGAFMVAITAGFAPLMIGGAIVAGLVAGVIAIIANWDKIKAAASAIWQAAADKVHAFVAAVAGDWEYLKGTAIVAWSVLKFQVVAYATQMVDGVIATFGKLTAVFDTVKAGTDKVIGFFKRMADAIVLKSIVPDMVTAIIDEFDILEEEGLATLVEMTDRIENEWDFMRGHLEGTTAEMVEMITADLGELEDAFDGVAAAASKVTPGGMGNGVISPGATVGASGGDITKDNAALAQMGETAQAVSDQVQALDVTIGSAQRNATAATIRAIRDQEFTWKDAQNEMASVAINTWGNITNTVSSAMAQQLIDGNNWRDTLKAIYKTVLSSFLNMALQMATQWVITETLKASTTMTANAAVSASGVATAGVTASANVAAAGAVSAANAGMSASVIANLMATWTVAKAVLSSIAAAMKATVFGIPVGLAITAALIAGSIMVMHASKAAGIALGAAALGTAALTFFQHGGIVTRPTLGMVGEAGPEAVIPLDRMGSMGGPTRQTIIVELDGRALTRFISNELIPVLRLKGVPL